MTSEHPIDSKNWYDVYEKANERETELPLITVQELATLQSGGQAGKDFLVIDVRRADCSVSLQFVKMEIRVNTG